MDRILFKGTDNQIKALQELIKNNPQLDLPIEDKGHQLYNLWHVDDVKSRYECDDDEAMDVLENALTNEATMDQIWLAIDFEAEDEGLTKKN